MMILVAWCCRRQGITVFCYNKEAAYICGCPHGSCDSLSRQKRGNPDNLQKKWEAQAREAKKRALSLWNSFMR